MDGPFFAALKNPKDLAARAPVAPVRGTTPLKIHYGE
jgi:hypothetical protein